MILCSSTTPPAEDTSAATVGRAHYDNKYIKVDGRWYATEMALTYLRGEGNIKKRLEDCANAYEVFLM